MIDVHVAFFAILREQTGAGELTIQTSTDNVGALFDELRQRYPALQRFSTMKFAINDRLVQADAPIAQDDRVLFFPPVAGG
ncbi:MAG: MoaD/ThiS family protein [Pseudomonadota bacterium]